MLDSGTNLTGLSQKLLSVPGVVEVSVVDKAAYLKIVRREFDEQALVEFQAARM